MTIDMMKKVKIVLVRLIDMGISCKGGIFFIVLLQSLKIKSTLDYIANSPVRFLPWHFLIGPLA